MVVRFWAGYRAPDYAGIAVGGLNACLCSDLRFGALRSDVQASVSGPMALSSAQCTGKAPANWNGAKTPTNCEMKSA
jgi:hypothetical protein